MVHHVRVSIVVSVYLVFHVLLYPSSVGAFTGVVVCGSQANNKCGHKHQWQQELPLGMTRPGLDNTDAVNDISRRSFLERSLLATAAASVVELIAPNAAWAAKKRDLDECLYTILRVREATQQETRLITTGKFKDLQRANVKLAVGMMIDNYRLADTFIAASSYIPDNTQRIDAGNAGQRAVQSLYTIMEYFDASDVQNMKVGSSSMEGKEGLVMKGLAAARTGIDEFLAYFPRELVDKALATIDKENELNKKEFDPALGEILNPAPAK